MFASAECSKGYRFPKAVISYAVYLYHRFLLSYRNVQELLFERGIDVSHETVRIWCAKFGPDLAEALRHRRLRCSRTWHLDEMRVVLGGVTHWLLEGRERAWRGLRCVAARTPGYRCSQALL